MSDKVDLRGLEDEVLKDDPNWVPCPVPLCVERLKLEEKPGDKNRLIARCTCFSVHLGREVYETDKG